MTIKKVCVIGAGVMGSGIAAQIANSATEVLLLDIPSRDEDRSSIARSAITKMHNTKPAPLSHPKRAELIEAGNLDDDLSKIKDCDLIIEVIVEKLDIKHNLYAKLTPYLRSDAILASNTSTLPLKRLKENLPAEVASRFMITHFFNPPRYMRLLELITDKSTNPKAIAEVSEFVTHRLGKSIVPSNDTPGFIANRIGCFLLELVLRKTTQHKLDVADVDRMLIESLYLPSTGLFGLYDLIGLDVMALIAKSLLNDLPHNDRFAQIYTEVPLVQKMIADGYTGRKGLGGFYRVKNIGAKKVKEVIDLNTGKYKKLSPDSSYNISKNTEAAITEIIDEFEVYVRSLVPEVTDNKADIDLAMKLGYSWKYGPFELFDLIKNNKGSPKSTASPKISKHKYDDNYNIFDIATKMNCLSIDAFSRLIESVQKAESEKKTLYIYSEAPNFSAGADLKFLLEKIQLKDWDAIEKYLKLGQKAMMRVKNSHVPVVSCARGVALGGGCELLLHSHYVVANQQLNAGLVESSLGLIPAFGGTKEMVLRAKGDAKLREKLLGNIIRRNKSQSADYFSEGYMTPLYVNMNQDYLLEEAVSFHKKQTNVTWSDASAPFELDDDIDEHTKLIRQKLEVFKEKSMNENDLLVCEREIFMELVRMSIAEERIKKIVR